MALGTLVVMWGYYMKNHKRIGAWAGAAGAIVDDDHHDAAAKPAKSKVAVLLVLAYFHCVWQDVVSVMKEWWRLFCALMVALCVRRGCLRKVERKRDTSSDNERTEALLSEHDQPIAATATATSTTFSLPMDGSGDMLIVASTDEGNSADETATPRADNNNNNITAGNTTTANLEADSKTEYPKEGKINDDIDTPRNQIV
jgi:hypothetical protein